MLQFDENQDLPIAQRQSMAAPGTAKVSPRMLMFVGGIGGSIAVVAAVLLAGFNGSSEDGAGVDRAAVDVTQTANAVEAVSRQPSLLLGHFAYEEAPREDLVAVGTFSGRTETLRSAAAESFGQMRAAAKQDGIELVPISGFRSIETQEFLFFEIAQSRALRPQERAAVSAPPGHSEHHTGYAIDIGDAARAQTHFEVTFESTPAFRWLQAHAARYGFELSFPKNNGQGVSYEPWHWRFVGDLDSLGTFYADRPPSTEIGE
ncbi:D-alanyl-D-alanine carboxypeptidase family protein [Synechococcus sp. PCC 7336]|uniref:M15 family metallopeptidase n=1 Tax=Synechococcus sp. PCC 7336 TaxID=195250 RepID=UPI000345558E|nr:M15 family metallopeptidase [Synechococcus sp. PCC 7336]